MGGDVVVPRTRDGPGSLRPYKCRTHKHNIITHRNRWSLLFVSLYILTLQLARVQLIELFPIYDWWISSKIDAQKNPETAHKSTAFGRALRLSQVSPSDTTAGTSLPAHGTLHIV